MSKINGYIAGVPIADNYDDMVETLESLPPYRLAAFELRATREWLAFKVTEMYHGTEAARIAAATYRMEAEARRKGKGK